MGWFGIALSGLVVGCQADQTGPTRPDFRFAASAAAANDDGPPTNFPSGRDTYRLGLNKGSGTTGLGCTAATDGGRTFGGFLRTHVDNTLLGVRLEIPAGAGPFPLGALIHRYGGGQNRPGDNAGGLEARGDTHPRESP